MHHHHKGQPALRVHPAEKLLQRRNSSRRRTQPDYRRRLLRIAPFLRLIARVLTRQITGAGIVLSRTWVLFVLFRHSIALQGEPTP